jgi:hypothetical protein
MINPIIGDDQISAHDQLVLLLIAKTDINNVFKLVIRFDRWDYPGNVDKNLSMLLDRQLIKAAAVDNFNHPIKYTFTEKGETVLQNDIDLEILIEHIKKMSNPGCLRPIVPAALSRM